MRITVVGAGPAGLYLAILLKRRDPSRAITVIERNRADDTFGFGVVFSDATMDNLAAADPESHRAITEQFWHWDEIDTFFGGEKLTSTGHGFAGMSRQTLLSVLQQRARALDIELRFETEVDDVEALAADCDLLVGADGLGSVVRAHGGFEPDLDWRPNRFVWLGTTFPYDAFTFYFDENEHGLWRVHAYRYEPERSTFIVECTEETLAAAGLDPNDEDATVAYCEALFADRLEGHRLMKNRSIWRQFPTVTCRRWHHETAGGHAVLIGDAVHTAHFSVGSGTKLALEDAIALASHLDEESDVGAALEAYAEERRPDVESLQRAAQASLEWFEQTERYTDLPPIQFNFSMLTRSLRVTHENLRMRDPAYVAAIDAWYAAQSAEAAGVEVAPDTPPLLTPYRLRGMLLKNRIVVSPMCMYSAVDGTVNDWHLVHLGSRAVGGAGLVMTEMTDVSAEGRITPGCAGLYAPEHVTAWRRIVEFVHTHSASKIGVQLGHAGRKGSTRLMWEGIDEPLDEGNWPLLAPSPLPYFPDRSQVPKPMDREDMDRVRDQFVASTKMALEAGFDLVEVHMAHGYLLATFLSPLTNQRDDAFGGSLENRLRYPLEVLDAVRAAWPEDRPLAVRISASDWKEGGITGDDTVAIAKALEAHGCDIVDVSSGQTVPDAKPEYGRLYQTPFADRIRLEAQVPTMTVGNISSYEDANSILAAGRADLCVIARAHLWDPYWTNHAAKALGDPGTWPPQYGLMRGYTPRFE